MHCCTTNSTSTLATSTAIRPRGNAAHFVRIPVICLSSLFSVVFSWPQLCPKLAPWRVLELCWVQGLSGWILEAGRAQRRNEEKRGESRRDPRRIEETGRGESRTNDTRKGETRGIEEARPEKRGALTPARPGAPPALPSGGFQAIPGRFVSFLVLFCFYGGNFSFSRNLPAVSVRLACGMATLR